MRQARTVGRVSYSRVSKRAESAAGKVNRTQEGWRGTGSGGGLMEEEIGHKVEPSASGHQIRSTGLCPEEVLGWKVRL